MCQKCAVLATIGTFKMRYLDAKWRVWRPKLGKGARFRVLVRGVAVLKANPVPFADGAQGLAP